MKFDSLTNKELCSVLEIFDTIDKLGYNDLSLRLFNLQQELDRFGDAFESWLSSTDVYNLRMRFSFGRLSIICEMSERFKTKFA